VAVEPVSSWNSSKSIYSPGVAVVIPSPSAKNNPALLFELALLADIIQYPLPASVTSRLVNLDPTLPALPVDKSTHALPSLPVVSIYTAAHELVPAFTFHCHVCAPLIEMILVTIPETVSPAPCVMRKAAVPPLLSDIPEVTVTREFVQYPPD
jgi:hypothetical protein